MESCWAGESSGVTENLFGVFWFVTEVDDWR